MQILGKVSHVFGMQIVDVKFKFVVSKYFGSQQWKEKREGNRRRKHVHNHPSHPCTLLEMLRHVVVTSFFIGTAWQQVPHSTCCAQTGTR